MELLIIALVILTIPCHIHETLSKLVLEFDQLEKMTEEVGMLLNNCTRLRINNIAVVSDSFTTIKWTSKSLERISLLNLNIVNQRKPFSWNMPWHEKFHTFIIISSTDDNVKHLIEGLRNTTLWNPAALYVLLDNRTIENGCENAKDFLKVAWQRDLLSSTYFCVDPVIGFMMYTYNPFIPWAPKHWKKYTSDYMNIQDPIWTLFKKKLISGVTTCKDITFKKTRTLDEYPLKTLAVNRGPHFGSKNHTFWYDVVDTQIFRDIRNRWTALSHGLVIYDESGDFSYYANITRGEYDMLQNAQFMYKTTHLTTTYPHRSVGFAILTRFPGYAAVPEKILRYMNPLFITGVLLISLATGIILGKCTGQGVTNGSLEVLRIMLGTSMTRFPETNPLRLHMLTILLLSTISIYSFQSKLSSLLISPIPKTCVNNLEDLKRSEYPIYIFHADRSTMPLDIPNSRIRQSDSWDCSEYVENMEGVACVADKRVLLKIASEKNLYLSKDTMSNMFMAYVVRPHWPLSDQFSRMLMLMNEGGLINFFAEQVQSESMHDIKLKRLEAKATSNDYRNLNLHNVLFAFYILLFGYVVSTAVFVGEYLSERLRKIKIKR